MLKRILTCLCAVAALAVTAQTVTVTGVVTDNTGEPLIGASVFEKGNPSKGCTTNIDGEFSIVLPPPYYANSQLCRL